MKSQSDNFDNSQPTIPVNFEGKVIFVCCSDWHVNPYEFTNTNPEQFYVFQNFGLRTDVCSSSSRITELDSIIDIIDKEPVSDIVICGHYPCQCIAWAWDRMDNGLVVKELFEEKYSLHSLPLSERLSYLNVLYTSSLWAAEPAIQARCEFKKIKIHTWVHNTVANKVEFFCVLENKFISI